MKLGLLLLLIIGLNLNYISQITPFEEWTTTSGTQNFFVKSETKTDGSGNVYVAGATINGAGNYDIYVAKYDNTGSFLWERQFDGNANSQDAATSIFLDASNNVYITGFITDTLLHGTDAVTIKISSAGSVLWTTSYNGSGNFNDSGADIFVDGSGNVFITGASNNTVPNTDFLVIKYNSSGVQQWVSTYNHSSNLNESGARIQALVSGRLTVVGGVQLNSTNYAYGVLTYNESTGALIGSLNLGTSSSNISQVSGLTKDINGNSYFSGAINGGGSNGLDYCVIKLDTNASIVWERHYNSASSLDDIATDLAVDNSGNVYVTGYSNHSTEGSNFITIKYNSSGTQQWVKEYNGNANGSDTAKAIILHNDTTIIVTGSTYNGNNFDFQTIKYHINGNELWEISYNSSDNLNDVAQDIAINFDGSIIVTGQSQTHTSLNYTTIKYIDPLILSRLPDTIPLGKAYSFIENRGQIVNSDSSLMPGIKYYNYQSKYASYFTDTLVSFVIASIDTINTTVDTLHRVDMRYVNPNLNVKVRATEITNDFTNYYLPQTLPYGRERVPQYRTLYMQELWDNIDLHISSNPFGIKYSFILSPGFNIRDLELLFDGQNGLTTDVNDDLVIDTDLGTIILSKAKVYQIDSNENYVPLYWAPDYNINSDMISFNGNLSTFNTNLKLVIVIEENYIEKSGIANLDWSTYYGGNGADIFFDVSTNETNRTWVTGITTSTSFPVSTGAFQSIYAGNQDVVVVNFDEDGSRYWSTYLGGSKLDGEVVQHNIVVNSTNSSFICFPTQSIDITLLSAGGTSYFDNSNTCNMNDCNDVYVGRLNDFGYLTWGSFFGGYDIGNVPTSRGNNLALDSQDNLIIVGQDLNIPIVTPSGSYTNSNGSAFIAKFNSNLELIWSSKFDGTNGETRIKGLCVDLNDDIIITGTTATSNFPTLDPGNGAYFQNTPAVSLNGFVAKFNNTNQLFWSTYLSGNGTDRPESVVTDNENNIIIVGSTSSTNFPTFNPGGGAFFQGTNNLGGSFFTPDISNDMFISKFSDNGNLLASTFFGGSANDGGFCVDVDKSNQIFIGGATISNNLPFASPNLVSGFEQEDHSEGHDVGYEGFFIVLNENFELIWTSYFGGDYTNSSTVDIIYGITITENSKMYIVGGTQSFAFFPLVDPGNAYFQGTKPGFTSGFISRFNLEGTFLNLEGVNQNQLPSFYIFPNPTYDIVNIDLSNFNETPLSMGIYDVSGKLINLYEIENEQDLFTMNLANYENGIYIITIFTSNNRYSSKLILNK